MKTLIALLTTALLSACSTPTDLKTGRTPYVFNVPVSYQLVLKRIVEQHRECDYSPLLPLGQVINDVQHYPDMRQATIVRGASGIGTQTNQIIEIKETAPGQTEVRLFQRFALEKFGKVYEGWANGGTVCP